MSVLWLFHISLFGPFDAFSAEIISSNDFDANWSWSFKNELFWEAKMIFCQQKLKYSMKFFKTQITFHFGKLVTVSPKLLTIIDYMG